MKTRLFASAIAATVVAAAVAVPPVFGPGPAQAQETSLAGKKGKVNRRLPRGHGDCPQAVKDYIAASGHSAYASTTINDFNAEMYICSIAINRKTTQDAEKLAVLGCQQGTKRFKKAFKGKCEVHASK